MTKMLNKQTRLCEATAVRVQFDKTHFSVGNGWEQMESWNRKCGCLVKSEQNKKILVACKKSG